MTWWSVPPNSRRGRLAWKVKRAAYRHEEDRVPDFLYHDVLKKSGKYSSAVCASGIGSNSMDSSQRMLWVHKRCSGITGRLATNQTMSATDVMGRLSPSTAELRLKWMWTAPCLMWRPPTATFVTCCALVGAVTVPLPPDGAIAARCCVVWGNFRKLLPLTTRHLHGGYRWGPNTTDLQELCRSDRAMIHWSCYGGTKDRSFTTTKTWHWGYYTNPRNPQSSCLKAVTDLPIPGTTGRGKPIKTWSECVKTYVSICGLAAIDPQDKDAWTLQDWEESTGDQWVPSKMPSLSIHIYL